MLRIAFSFPPLIASGSSGPSMWALLSGRNATVAPSSPPGRGCVRRVASASAISRPSLQKYLVGFAEHLKSSEPALRPSLQYYSVNRLRDRLLALVEDRVVEGGEAEIVVRFLLLLQLDVHANRVADL